MYNFSKEAPGGFQYLSWDDAKKKICNKCKTSYYGDWNITDCNYCPIPDTISIMERYAYRLSNYTTREDDDGR